MPDRYSNSTLADAMGLINQNTSLLAYHRQRLRRILKRRRAFVRHDNEVGAFLPQGPADPDAFARVVGYFWEAYRHYVDDWGTVAYYPGWPSIYGAAADAIEGVSRNLPLWAAYSTSPLAKGDPQVGAMQQAIKKALLNGTNDRHPGYWGDIYDKSTLICEGADIALSLWLVKDTLWTELDTAERKRILGWLAGAVGRETADNNWHLFVVLIDAVLADLDPGHDFASGERYDRIRGMYVGDGCFRDGPAGRVDFYNAWAFHYALYFLFKIRPGLVADFAPAALQRYVSWYQHIFTDKGFPLYGRSLCYRLAAPVPLIAAADLERGVGIDLAMSVLWSCWRYFLANGALAKGRPTQGVFGDNITLLDPYSGPASSFWGARSLVMYYYTSRATAWSNARLQRLPVADGHLAMQLEGPGIVLEVDGSTESTQLRLCDSNADQATATETQSTKQRIQQLVYARAVRPANNFLDRGICLFDSHLGLYS